MWLTLKSDTVFVDAPTYIASQPVDYFQVEDVIDQVRLLGRPVQARIDISGIRLRQVNIMGVVRIIWELHEHTYGEPLLNSIVFSGVPFKILYLWSSLQTLLPEFVVNLIKFDSFRDQFTSDEDEDEWSQDEYHEA